MKQEDQATQMLKDLTLHMAQAIVNHPDQVRVEETEGASIIILELKVDPEDIGRVIGKEGRVANAMRTLLHTSSARLGKRINLEILSP
ncbi:MAG: KH domain-containing protein [Nitrospira sp.]|nr:KH domain-containing protein [Nitrospira sp.]